MYELNLPQTAHEGFVSCLLMPHTIHKIYVIHIYYVRTKHVYLIYARTHLRSTRKPIRSLRCVRQKNLLSMDQRDRLNHVYAA